MQRVLSSGKLQEPQPQLLLQLAGNRQRHLQHRTRLKKTGSGGLLAGFLNRFFSVSCVLVLFYFLNFCTPLFVIFFRIFLFCFTFVYAHFFLFFFSLRLCTCYFLFSLFLLSPLSSSFGHWVFVLSRRRSFLPKVFFFTHLLRNSR